MNPTKPPFKNPVLTVPPTLQLRSTLVVKSCVDARIKQIYPKSGVLQTTINLLLDKLCYELDRCELKEFDPGAYERAITGASIVLDCDQRSPVAEPTTSVGPAQSAEANNGNDGPGAFGLVSHSTGASVVVSDDGRAPKARRTKSNKGEKSS